MLKEGWIVQCKMKLEVGRLVQNGVAYVNVHVIVDVGDEEAEFENWKKKKKMNSDMLSNKPVHVIYC